MVQPVRRKIIADGEIIEQVTEVNYLGSAHSEKEINVQVIKTKQKSSKLFN